MFTKQVAYLPASIDACALYREFLPHLYTEGSQFLFNPHHKLPIDHFIDFDIAVVQRLNNEGNLAAIQLIKSKGLKVVYDLDDNLWEIPAYNPARKILESYQAGFRVCAKECHLVTVSTKPLKAVVQRNIGSKVPIVVLGNAIDMNLFHPIPEIERKEVAVGWGGSITHSGDTEEVFGLLPELLGKNENMHFEIAGQAVMPSLQDNPKARQRAAVPVSEYPARLASWRWDIFLAPLRDNSFNRSKSALKMIEAGALKKPCLASPIAPYLDLVSLDKELDWLICKTKQQWKDKITELVSNKEQRTYYGNRLYDLVKEHFNIEKNIKQWKTTYESICS